MYTVRNRKRSSARPAWRLWAKFWMKFAGPGRLGRTAMRIAALFAPPYKARMPLARMADSGFIAPDAVIYHGDLVVGNNIYIGSRVTIFEALGGGSVTLGDRVHLHQDVIIENGEGGVLTIDTDTHIQPRCQLSVYKGTLRIGRNVQIAANCGFYPYNHGLRPDEDVARQDLETRGGILVEDDVWIGYNATVLDGVRIGRGAVIGAGAVVTHDIPEGAIAVGVPARVVRLRGQAGQGKPSSVTRVGS